MNLYSPFEWFYFDLHGDDGLDLVCTIHPHPFNSVFKVALCDIFVYKGKQTLLHHYFVCQPPAELSAGPGTSLQLDENNCIDYNKNSVRVQLRGKKIQLDLEFEGGLQSKLERKQLLPDHSDGRFEWIVAAPLSVANARVTFGDRNWRFNGTVYHDYNCGDINLKKELKYWLWAKYYVDDSLLVVGKIQDINGDFRSLALKATNNEVTFDDSIEIEEKGSAISYHGFGKTYTFSNTVLQPVDRVYFYMDRKNRSYYYSALREVISGLVRDKVTVKFIQKSLNNTYYKRNRINASYGDGTPATGFMEEMFL